MFQTGFPITFHTCGWRNPAPVQWYISHLFVEFLPGAGFRHHPQSTWPSRVTQTFTRPSVSWPGLVFSAHWTDYASEKECAQCFPHSWLSLYIDPSGCISTWISGWWYTYPSEQYESVGIAIPNLWKHMNNVSNHRPDMCCIIVMNQRCSIPWNPTSGFLLQLRRCGKPIIMRTKRDSHQVLHESTWLPWLTIHEIPPWNRNLNPTKLDYWSMVSWPSRISQIQHVIFPISSVSGWWFELLWKIWVSWDDYSQYMEKWNMFQTTNQNINIIISSDILCNGTIN